MDRDLTPFEKTRAAVRELSEHRRTAAVDRRPTAHALLDEHGRVIKRLRDVKNPLALPLPVRIDWLLLQP